MIALHWWSLLFLFLFLGMDFGGDDGELEGLE